MTLNPHDDYDNPYWPNNVMGHAVALLKRYRDQSAKENGIHLDLGCGFGRMAEAITEECGAIYVGVDGAAAGPASLKERGFEAHQLLFGDPEETLSALRKIINGRPLLSLSMLDTLEHLPEGDDVLRVIRTLIAEHETHAVISVPNNAHRDVGFRLAFGQWDYTQDGLLDHTHCRLFSETTLERVLHHAGLQIVDRNPCHIANSDQKFPRTHPVLAEGTHLNEALRFYRGQVDENATVNQFVMLVQAGAVTEPESYKTPEEINRSNPFLTVLTRTQGIRLSCLEEVLTALVAQDDQDFEVLIVGHKLPVERQLLVERTIDDCVGRLRDKCRLVLVDDGNRTRPLNVGFAEARGDYVAILDDDDMPFANWVSSFRKLSQEKPGRVLRSATVRQDVTMAKVRGDDGIRATSKFTLYPKTFNFYEHLDVNQSPPVGLAFPRSAFSDLRIHFDESLTTTEDWDYLMHCAAILGVHSYPGVTSVYRWWSDNDRSSRSDHNQAEWKANHEKIWQKLDLVPIILPPGSARELRRQLGQDAMEERTQLLAEVSEILSSWSWKLTAPLRWPARRRGRKDPVIRTCFDMSPGELRRVHDKLRKSGSWKKTKVFRKRKKGHNG